MSEEQYSWTPITVDEVVVGETYLRATHRADRRQVSEGLVVERDQDFLDLETVNGRRCVDAEFRDLERRDLIAFPAPVPGEQFTRTYDDDLTYAKPDCRVTEVLPLEPHGSGWRVEYSHPRGTGILRVLTDGTVTNTSCGAPGRFVRPATGAWVQATPENVQLGSKIKGAPHNIGGELEAEVTDLLVHGNPTRFRAKTLNIITPTRNGGDMDLAHGPLGDGYFYQYDNVQVWQESASVTVPPVPAFWHPVDFAQLQHGDTVRVTFTNARGQTSVKEGTVTRIRGARVTFQDQDGADHAASSLRTFEISNRVPEPVPVFSERYPTIHHLKAAIFDVAAPNYKNGTWCSDTHDFLQELGIVDNLYPAEGLKDQADQVHSLIAKLQSESSSSRGISAASMERAFDALGIPKTPAAPPPQKMMTVTVAVPADFNAQVVAELLNNRMRDITVEHVEES